MSPARVCRPRATSAWRQPARPLACSTCPGQVELPRAYDGRHDLGRAQDELKLIIIGGVLGALAGVVQQFAIFDLLVP